MDFSRKENERIQLLADRIKKLSAKANLRKQILRAKYPWVLLQMGLRVEDISPTYAEMCLALSLVKGELR